MVIARDRFFYPILTQMMDSFSGWPLNIIFLCLKMPPEVPEYAEMRHNMILVTCLSTCGCSIFIFPKGRYGV